MEEKESLTLTPRLCRTLLFTSLGLSGLLSLSFLFLPYLALERKASAATDVSLGADWSPVSLELDPDYDLTLAYHTSSGTTGSLPSDPYHGDINFGAITPSSRDSTTNSYGTQRILQKTLAVTSSGKSYSIYLSMSGNSSALFLSGSTSISIPPVAGTFTTPSVFDDSGWGFAVPTATAFSAFDYTRFNDSSIKDQNLTATGTGASVYNSVPFATVPTVDSPVKIFSATTTNNNGFGSGGDEENNHFSIYYSAMIDTDILAGEYSNSIIYTALASSDSLDTASDKVTRSEAYAAENSQETLRFDLTSSTTGFIDKDDLTVYLIPHSIMSAANYDPTDSTVLAAKDTDKTCTISSTSDFSLTASGAELTCTMPAAHIVDDSGSDTDGFYDFLLEVPTYNLTFVSHYTEIENNTTVDTPSVAYIGLQSVKSVTTETDTSDPNNPVTTTTNNYYIDTMQEMTSSICKNTNMWGSGTGTDAKVYDYQGESTTTPNLLASAADPDNDGDTSDASPTASFLNLGSFLLTDNRDDKPYLVRRLADGNCWMVQNLDLNLADFAGTETLTKDNTDLNSKSTWDPSASALAIAKSYDPSVTQDNYFETFAINRLGVAQTVQFQPYGFKGTVNGVTYYWGSLLSDDGNYTALETATDNANAAVPRSYDAGMSYTDPGSATSATDFYGTNHIQKTETYTVEHATGYFGDYYNWYAVTAESIPHTGGTKDAPDSICPAGWRLPVGTNIRDVVNDDRQRLFYAVYGLVGGDTQEAQDSIEKLSQTPLSIDALSADYNYNNGNTTYDTRTGMRRLWIGSQTTDTHRGIRLWQNYGQWWPSYTTAKAFGYPARCLAR